MKWEIRRYLIFELRRRGEIKKELDKVRTKISTMKEKGTVDPMAENLLNREQNLYRLHSAISAVYDEMDEDETMVAKLKFGKKRLSDMEIIEQLPMERTAYYAKVRNILKRLATKLGVG